MFLLGPNPPSARDLGCKHPNCNLFKPRLSASLSFRFDVCLANEVADCSYCAPTKAPNDSPHISNRAPWGAVRSRSEIRLIRTRNRRVFSRIIFMRVFGTDKFLLFVQPAPISDSRRPGRGENPFVLDHKLEL
jgi:hypothetical protein